LHDLVEVPAQNGQEFFFAAQELLNQLV